MLDDGDAIFLGISRAFPDLAFDGFFALVVRGIASIDHGGHGRHLTLTSLNGNSFFQNHVSYNVYTIVWVRLQELYNFI